jgi:hypothetical protein
VYYPKKDEALPIDASKLEWRPEDFSAEAKPEDYGYPRIAEWNSNNS